MHRPSSLRSSLLACALTLATVPGCDPTPPPSPPLENLGSQSQELFCGGTLVPAMTAANAPSGLVQASGSATDSNVAWKAFDSDTSANSMWVSAVGQSPAWLVYDWVSGAKRLTHYSIQFSNGALTGRAPKDWTLQGWNGSTWVVVDTRTGQTDWAGSERRAFSIATPGSYVKYRLHVTDDNAPAAGVNAVSIADLSFFSCECATGVSQVPVMTGATTPSGIVRSSSVYSSAYDAWKAFDAVDAYASTWLSYPGQAPVWLDYEWADGSRYITRYALSFANGTLTSRAPRTWTLQGWNGSDWVTVDTRNNETGWLGVERREYTVASPGEYARYRLHVTEDNDARSGIQVISLSKVALMGCERDTTPPPPPRLTGFTPEASNTVTPPVIAGTAEAGATVRLYSGAGCMGSPFLTTTASATGAFSASHAMAANATSTVSAKAADSLGNISACSNAISYVHDSLPPAVPFQLAFAPGSPGQSVTPRLTGRTEPSALVEVFSGPGCTGTPLSTFTASDTEGLFTFDLSVPANTTASFSLRALDWLGNASACSTANTYVHDNTPPPTPTFEAGLLPFPEAPFVAAVRTRSEPHARIVLFSNAQCTTATGVEVVTNNLGETLLPLQSGQLGVTQFARAVDAAGNASGCASFSESCMAGFKDCDGNPANGCEVSTMDDAANCGACGTTCAGAASATGVCGGGTCGLGCVVGTFDCDGNPANGCESTAACAPGVCQVQPFKELLITDLSVVEDPVRTTNGGAWTFGTLMRRMNGGVDPSELVRQWLRNWNEGMPVGASFVAPRPLMSSLVLGPWEARSGGPTAPLDFDTAPFRLLAIVNRVDLRHEGTHAGEGRFVFGVTDATGGALPFTVILEYELPGDGPEDIQRWARDWHELGRLALGTPAYNAKLQAITDRFTGAFAAPGRFMGSAISQVRTNENALNPLWELREFHLGPQGLAPAPVALTPDITETGSPLVVDFIQENLADVLAGKHQVPLFYQGRPFLGGSALTPFFFFWDAPGVDPEARHQFSLNTCSGCHAGETNTFFLHLLPRSPGQPSGPSPFLVGTSVPDPLTSTPRVFNDLGRRQDDLETLVCGAPASLSLTAGHVGESLLAPRRLSGDTAAVPGFPPRSNLPPGRVH